MNRQQVSCKLVLDRSDYITKWVCCGLGSGTDWLGEHLTVGFFVSGKLAGGLIYHDIRPGCDLFWTIFTTNKKWCNRRVLKAIFGLAFNVMQVRRISLLINTDNARCLKLVEKLGFKREGVLREYREDGSDCYFYGMLKSENKWKGKNNE